MQNEIKGVCIYMQNHKNDKSVTKTIDTTAERVVKYMLQSGKTLCTAESCTRGRVSEMITAVAGASKMFLGGVCSYTEQAKQKLLGVKKQTLDEFTVYSPQVASEMSKGALELFGADVAVGITGIAGPGGENGKPAGTVYVSVRDAHFEIVRDICIYKLCADPDRDTVRRLSTQTAREMVQKKKKKSAG